MEGDGLTIGIRRDQLGVIRAYLEDTSIWMKDIGSDTLLSFMDRNFTFTIYVRALRSLVSWSGGSARRPPWPRGDALVMAEVAPS